MEIMRLFTEAGGDSKKAVMSHLESKIINTKPLRYTVFDFATNSYIHTHLLTFILFAVSEKWSRSGECIEILLEQPTSYVLNLSQSLPSFDFFVSIAN